MKSKIDLLQVLCSSPRVRAAPDTGGEALCRTS